MCRGWSQHQPPSFSHLPSCTTKLTIHHWAINSLDRKSETAKGSLKLWTSIMNACDGQFCLLLDGLSDTMANYLQTSQVHPTKTSSTTWRTSSEPWAFLRSSTSFENQSRPKQSKRKKLQTSSIVFSGQKLRSWTFDKSDLTWNGSVSASLISPSSFEVFGRQVATSNINSRWKHPVQLWKPMQTRPLSKCMLLVCAYQRTRQRKMGIAKKTCEGFFWRLFGKGRMFGRPFFKTNPEELSTLCIYPKQLLNKTKKVSINKTLFISTLAQYFILQLMRNIPMNNNDIHRVTLAQHLLYHSKGAVRCWGGGNNQKYIAKEQGHGRKTYKVFSLTRFYQFGEDNWNIMFKQILRCYVLVLTKEQGKGKWALPKKLGGAGGKRKLGWHVML